MKVELKLNGIYELNIIPEDDLERTFLKAILENPGEIKVDSAPAATTNDGRIVLTKERTK